MNELILMQIGQEQGHETVNIGARRSKVKVTVGQSYICRSGGGVIFNSLGQVRCLVYF